MKIQVTVKNVYGNEMIYPACENSEIFASLVRKKTFDSNDLRNIAALGFEVEVVAAIGVINSNNRLVLSRL